MKKMMKKKCDLVSNRNKVMLKGGIVKYQKSDLLIKQSKLLAVPITVTIYHQRI